MDWHHRIIKSTDDIEKPVRSKIIRETDPSECSPFEALSCISRQRLRDNEVTSLSIAAPTPKLLSPSAKADPPGGDQQVRYQWQKGIH